VFVTQLLIVYCALIVVASMFGGWLPSVIRLTHNRMQTLISFVGGLMLGVGLLHMLPHGIAMSGSVDQVIGWALAGLLVMFFLIRTFHFHHHDTPELGDEHIAGDSPASRHSPGKQQPDVHSHDDHPRHACQAGHHGPSSLSWIGVAVGLGLHTLIDGIALAAAVASDAAHADARGLFGIGVFLAILLHKPLDALSITSLMAASDWSQRARQAINITFALMCPAGVVLLLSGMDHLAEHPEIYIGNALGFSAGVFLCISLGDLLPELQFHAHDRLKLSVALLLGVAVAYGVRYLEPSHVHSHGHETAPLPRGGE